MGRLLFLDYIRDLLDVGRSSNIRLFADDSLLWQPTETELQAFSGGTSGVAQPRSGQPPTTRLRTLHWSMPQPSGTPTNRKMPSCLKRDSYSQQGTPATTLGTGHPVQDTQYRTPGTGHPVQDTWYRTSGTGHPVQDTQYRTPGTGHPVQDTHYRTPGTVKSPLHSLE